MNPAQLLDHCNKQGLTITVNNGRLSILGREDVIASMQPLLAAHRDEILSYLLNISDCKWRDYFHERAAIYEFDSHYTLAEAERQAYRDVLVDYIESTHPQILAGIHHAIHNNALS